MADLQQLEDQIVGLSLLDAAALVKRLEEKLGVSAAAAAPVMVAGGGGAAAGAAPAEEKTEFAVVLTAENGQGAIELANRIKNALRTSLALTCHTMRTTVSIGIASHPADASDVESLVRHADAAMYESKAAGRDTVRCYTAEMNSRAVAKSDVENALRLALPPASSTACAPCCMA